LVTSIRADNELQKRLTEATIADKLETTGGGGGGGGLFGGSGTTDPIGGVQSNGGTIDRTAVENAFTNLVGKLPQNVREFYIEALNRQLDVGGVVPVQETLKALVESSIGAEESAKLNGRTAMLTSIRDLSSQINEYVEAGGTTNIFRGGYEKMLNKLGTTSDPRLAEIEARIHNSITTYTVAQSGAQFSERELRIYESLFPSTSNVFELNSSKISALERELSLRQNTFYRNKIGPGNYDILFGGIGSSQTGSQTQSQYSNPDLSDLDFRF